MTENKRMCVRLFQVPVLLIDPKQVTIIPLKLRKNIILSSVTLSFMNSCFLLLN